MSSPSRQLWTYSERKGELTAHLRWWVATHLSPPIEGHVQWRVWAPTHAPICRFQRYSCKVRSWRCGQGRSGVQVVEMTGWNFSSIRRHATKLWEEGDVKQSLFRENAVSWSRQGLRSTSSLSLSWWAAVDTPTLIASSPFGTWSSLKQRQFINFFCTMHNYGRQWEIALDTSTRVRLLSIQAKHSFNVCCTVSRSTPQ